MEVPCASVLKPVFAFLSPPGKDYWKLTSAAVIASDNSAMDALVERIGGLETLTHSLSELSGVELSCPESWGSFMVNKETLTKLYVGMLNSPGERAGKIFHLMRHVHPQQLFGLPVCTPMKAGWDLWDTGKGFALVTNIVRLDHYDVEAYVGAVEVDAPIVDEWFLRLDRGGPCEVIPLHLSNAPHIPWLQAAQPSVKPL